MIKFKHGVKRCYDLRYSQRLPTQIAFPRNCRKHPIVELGSGSSFIREQRSDVITSDVKPGRVDLALDGRAPRELRDGIS